MCECPSWHKGSIKGGMTGWAERYIRSEVYRKIGFDVNKK